VAPYLSERKDGVCLAVKVQSRASRNEIGGPLGNELKIKVTAPPVDSAANEAVIKLVAKTLGCAPNSIELLRGHNSTHKQIIIRGMTLANIETRLHSRGL
jgi:uncharacterized protein (TIGR00251 family)